MPVKIKVNSANDFVYSTRKQQKHNFEKNACKDKNQFEYGFKYKLSNSN